MLVRRRAAVLVVHLHGRRRLARVRAVRGVSVCVRLERRVMVVVPRGAATLVQVRLHHACNATHVSLQNLLAVLLVLPQHAGGEILQLELEHGVRAAVRGVLHVPVRVGRDEHPGDAGVFARVLQRGDGGRGVKLVVRRHAGVAELCSDAQEQEAVVGAVVHAHEDQLVRPARLARLALAAVLHHALRDARDAQVAARHLRVRRHLVQVGAALPACLLVERGDAAVVVAHRLEEVCVASAHAHQGRVQLALLAAAVLRAHLHAPHDAGVDGVVCDVRHVELDVHFVTLEFKIHQHDLEVVQVDEGLSSRGPHVLRHVSKHALPPLPLRRVVLVLVALDGLQQEVLHTESTRRLQERGVGLAGLPVVATLVVAHAQQLPDREQLHQRRRKLLQPQSLTELLRPARVLVELRHHVAHAEVRSRALASAHLLKHVQKLAVVDLDHPPLVRRQLEPVQRRRQRQQKLCVHLLFGCLRLRQHVEARHFQAVHNRRRDLVHPEAPHRKRQPPRLRAREVACEAHGRVLWDHKEVAGVVEAAHRRLVLDHGVGGDHVRHVELPRTHPLQLVGERFLDVTPRLRGAEQRRARQVVDGAAAQRCHRRAAAAAASPRRLRLLSSLPRRRRPLPLRSNVLRQPRAHRWCSRRLRRLLLLLLLRLRRRRHSRHHRHG
eukprot:Rhum_TRINITY_DN14252_c7_g1::Rhum_TRINITY_DN14252_c7_g1_i1::g.75507::m.75507